ncbi:MAG TPA: hypothetical protein PK530_07510 [Anaerolineales bacterium]|nr:hypothetical protein [Anaerolineales bacterium]
MPGFLLHVNAVMQCTHGAPAMTTPTQPRVLVNGQPVATAANLITVAGCPFTIPGPKPQPCVTVKWLMLSTRVLVNGQPALLQPSPSGAGTGICQSVEQIPQGPPIIGMVQTRVIGT